MKGEGASRAGRKKAAAPIGACTAAEGPLGHSGQGMPTLPTAHLSGGEEELPKGLEDL